MGNGQGDISQTQLQQHLTSTQIELKGLSSAMGCDYYGPEPDIMPLEAPSEKTSTASGQKVFTPENPDDCCSSGKCADNKPQNHTDVPDCCRGKVSPCCDTFCLDRLAMRECGMSATAAPGPNIQPNSEYPLFENKVQRIPNPL
jgi:Cu2+-exporting ATPase